jgi:CRP/FNR family transcriptional regulator
VAPPGKGSDEALGRGTSRGPGETTPSWDRTAIEGDRHPFLERLQPAKRDLVLSRATLVDHPRGAIVQAQREPGRAYILLEGLLRTYVASPGGREVTVRYVYPNELVGGKLVMGEGFDASAEALLDSRLALLYLADLAALVHRDTEVAEALAADLAARYGQTLVSLALFAFGTATQRIAHDLLLRGQRTGDVLEIAVTQAQLAESVGTVREIVARAFRQLRALGLIRTERGRVIIPLPASLEDFAVGHLLYLRRPNAT